MNKTYKDTDLREALRRKYSDTPQLPADFMAKMEERLDAKPVAKTRRLWTWVAAAASFLLIIGIGMMMKDGATQPAQKMAATAEKPATVIPSPQDTTILVAQTPRPTSLETVDPRRSNIPRQASNGYRISCREPGLLHCPSRSRDGKSRRQREFSSCGTTHCCRCSPATAGQPHCQRTGGAGRE